MAHALWDTSLPRNMLWYDLALGYAYLALATSLHISRMSVKSWNLLYTLSTHFSAWSLLPQLGWD